MFKTNRKTGQVFNDDKKRSDSHHGSVKPNSGIKMDHKLVGDPEASRWKNLTTGERYEVVEKVFHPTDGYALSFYDLRYWTEFSPKEQKAIMKAIDEMPKGKHEWHVLDSAEQELLLHGKKNPFFKEKIERLPESIQKEIVPKGYEETSSQYIYDTIKKLKHKYAGRTDRAWYNDNVPTREAANRHYGEHNDLTERGNRYYHRSES